MYIPEPFKQHDAAAMQALMRSSSLATLVTRSADGMVADHIPLHLSAEPHPFGLLQGHVARANPLWHSHPAGVDVLAIFHGPDAYISPAWYASKQETQKVVPTWNYAAVHAYGRLRVIDDRAWLKEHLAALTQHHETSVSSTWSMGDAPEDYIERLLGIIVGIEIAVTRIEGKWKASQNRPSADRDSVSSTLRARGDGAMADLMTRDEGTPR